MSRLPVTTKRNTSTKKVTPGTSRPSTEVSLVSKRDIRSGVGKQLGVVKPSDENVQAPTALQKRVFKQALSKSAQKPGKVVRSVGATRSTVAPLTVSTKRGKECVVQQMKLETTVQRTPKAEYIAKTVTGVDLAPSGVAHQIELTSHQIDPTHATESAGVNETISTTSTLSITSGGKKLQKSFKKKTVKSDKLAPQPNLNPHHINRLVKEETEDVENTLKMVPPDLVSPSVDHYPIKRKVQALRLTSEPISILTESVIHPTPTADEVECEAPPEVLSSVIDAVEKGATPNSAPNQIFNSLFPEVQESRINISSVAPGPLSDIVVPTEAPKKLVEEVLTQEMEDFLVDKVQNRQYLPKDDVCTENNIKAEASTFEGEFRAPKILEDEVPPWDDATVQKISSLVGGDPIDLLETSDFAELKSPADITQELSKGIEYFIDADVVPYETKIQIRGSKLPKWFPGYMAAFPHLPEIVKISRKPSEILHTAWKAVQPKIFPDDSLLIM